MISNTRFRLRNKATGEEWREFTTLRAITLCILRRERYGCGVDVDEIVEYTMTPTGKSSLKEHMDKVRERKTVRRQRAIAPRGAK